MGREISPPPVKTNSPERKLAQELANAFLKHESYHDNPNGHGHTAIDANGDGKLTADERLDSYGKAADITENLIYSGLIKGQSYSDAPPDVSQDAHSQFILKAVKDAIAIQDKDNISFADALEQSLKKPVTAQEKKELTMLGENVSIERAGLIKGLVDNALKEANRGEKPNKDELLSISGELRTAAKKAREEIARKTEFYNGLDADHNGQLNRFEIISGTEPKPPANFKTKDDVTVRTAAK